ncbi:MAG: LamB/YcsF family protein, partial [Microcella sp.]|uniref:LamB/YcsF family protein n=1 Tax=Microcella sp. TaxID=1913979 RepID=UPI002717C787
QLREQVARLADAARAAGGDARYLKPHGALYNRIVRDAERAEVVARVAAAAGLPVMGMPGSAIERASREAGIRFVTEAFVDRAYRADGSLVPRTEPGAVLHDVAAVAARAVRLAVDGSVVAVDGSIVRVEAESLCVHGDTPGAVAMARAVRDALAEAGVDVRPMLGAP